MNGNDFLRDEGRGSLWAGVAAVSAVVFMVGALYLPMILG
jgi:hypothetical protein